MAKPRKRAPSSFQVTPLGTQISRVGSTLRVQAGGVDQSAVDLDRPTTIEFEYLQHMDLLADLFFPHLAPHPRVFHAGAGACALPLAWEGKFPLISQVAAEVDEDLANLVKEEAGLRRKPRLKLRVGDAAQILQGSSSKYHLIVRDAFMGPITPHHLRTSAWMDLVSSRLHEGGAYFANVGRDRGGPAKEDVAAVAQAFPTVTVITDPKAWRGDRNGNLVVAGWAQAPDLDEVDRRLRRLPLPVRLFRPNEVNRWLGGATPLAR